MHFTFSYKVKSGVLLLAAIGLLACGSDPKRPSKRLSSATTVKQTCPKGLTMTLAPYLTADNAKALASGTKLYDVKRGEGRAEIYLFEPEDPSYKSIYFNAGTKSLSDKNDPGAQKYERVIMFSGDLLTSNLTRYTYARKLSEGGYELLGVYNEIPQIYNAMDDWATIPSVYKVGTMTTTTFQRYAVSTRLSPEQTKKFNAMFGDLRLKTDGFSAKDYAVNRHKNDLLLLARTLHENGPEAFESRLKSIGDHEINLKDKRVSVVELIKAFEDSYQLSKSLDDGYLDLSAASSPGISYACTMLALDHVDLDGENGHQPVKSIDLRGINLSEGNLISVLRFLNSKDGAGNRTKGKSVGTVFVAGNQFNENDIARLKSNPEFSRLIGSFHSLGQIEFSFD